ncbi:MAG: PsbP-related protein, partial [archaeon]
ASLGGGITLTFGKTSNYANSFKLQKLTLNMQKLILVSIVLFVVLLFFGCTQTEDTSSKTDSNFLHFKDANFGLEFDYPAGWGKPDIGYDDNFQIIDFSVTDLNLLMVRFRKIDDFSSYMKDELNLIPLEKDFSLKDIRNYMITLNGAGHTEKFVEVDDVNAYEFMTKTDASSAMGNFATLNVFLVKGNKLYEISLTASPSFPEYVGYELDFDAMLKSFKFVN